MGYGGYLTWTAAAREIHDRYSKLVIPVEQHGNQLRLIKSPIFENNPYIVQDIQVLNDSGPEGLDGVPLVLNHPDSNYCKKDTPEKAVHRYDRHMIEQICECYGIANPELKCELYFTDEELTKAEELVGDLDKPYIVVEPQVKDEYTVNKSYPMQKWQWAVSELVKAKDLCIVQVGKDDLYPNKLWGAKNLTGKTTFREAAAIIAKAKLLVASEGGLMHAANAVGTPAVIVYTGFIHPRMTGYQENTNIWIGEDHGPCGMKVRCDLCAKDAEDHDPQEIIDAVRERLK